MTVVGGLRARYLQDSLTYLITNGLVQLGWFDTDRSHRPLRFVPAPLDWNQPIICNLLTVSTVSRRTEFIELGSDLSEDNVATTVDIYGESESFGIDLANDIRDLLRGRLPGGATGGVANIFDLASNPPPVIGYVTIDEPRVACQPTKIASARAIHWFTVDFNLLDTYYS